MCGVFQDSVYVHICSVRAKRYVSQYRASNNQDNWWKSCPAPQALGLIGKLKIKIATQY